MTIAIPDWQHLAALDDQIRRVAAERAHVREVESFVHSLSAFYSPANGKLRDMRRALNLVRSANNDAERQWGWSRVQRQLLAARETLVRQLAAAERRGGR